MMLRMDDLPEPDLPIRRTFFFWGFLKLFILAALQTCDLSEWRKRDSVVQGQENANGFFEGMEYGR